MKMHIKNGRVIDPKNKLDQVTDVWVKDGKIAAIGHAPNGFVAEKIMDATGCVVCPGLVDLSARLREPGEEYKARLASELQAAVAGGVTSLACPPDTDPVLDESGLVETLKYRAKNLGLAHVYPLGAVTQQLKGKALAEMNELTRAGCVGFSQANVAIVDTQVLWRAMEYASTFNYTLFLHAEDPFLAADGVAHDGEVASRLGLKGIPVAAETLALANLLYIAKATGTRVHISRVSSAEGVEMIRQAKAQGLNVSCDVDVHHLHLTEHDIAYFDANCHLKPPLRTLRDKAALSAGLKDGTIDAICSDHTPVDDDDKLVPFASSKVGATSLELLLPLTLKWAAQEKLSLSQAIHLISTAPAQILNAPAGDLSEGSEADLILIETETFWRISPSTLKSQGKNTPFIQQEVAGKVRATIVQGRVVYGDLFRASQANES